MSKQNIYDNDSFYENFEKIRSEKINFNDVIETPIILKMLPELSGIKSAGSNQGKASGCFWRSCPSAGLYFLQVWKNLCLQNNTLILK